MRAPPADLGEEEVLAALVTHWDWRTLTLEYVALGMGTHHWAATDAGGSRRFVDVDAVAGASGSPELAMQRRRVAFETSRALYAAGLGFVIPPIASTAGDLVVALTDDYAMAVFRWVDARAVSGDQTRELAKMLEQLHASTDAVATIAATETFAVPRREVLDRALRELDRPWTGGPFSEPAREALHQVADDVEELLAVYDGRVARAGGPTSRWVVTHGEPHEANLIESPDGLVLIDWDTVLIAPPERDLWWVEDAVAVACTSSTGVEVDPELLALYRLWFDLDKIAMYTDGFRRPHRLGLETSETWDIFTIFLDQARSGAHR